MRSTTRIRPEGRRIYILPSVGREELLDAMTRCSWQASVAAEYLGVHRSTVYRLLERYEIEKEGPTQ